MLPICNSNQEFEVFFKKVFGKIFQAKKWVLANLYISFPTSKL